MRAEIVTDRLPGPAGRVRLDAARLLADALAARALPGRGSPT